MKTEVMRADHPVALDHAVDVLRNGGLVVFPTDTVYGLAALPLNEQYIERLYIAKGRNSSKAIAVLIGDFNHLSIISHQVTPLALRLATHFWPGPLTLVISGHPSLPSNLSADKTIGVRMPDHLVALNLLRKAGPLAVTSANLSGRENALTPQQVLEQLDGRVHLVLDGGITPGGVPSTVVHCLGNQPTILRHGPITLEQIQEVLEVDSHK